MSTPSGPFPAHAPLAYPLFYRSYSRRDNSEGRESWPQVVARNLRGLVTLGHLSEEDADLLMDHQLRLTSLPSGRWLWVGGTDWAADPRNFYGAYNCANLHLDHPEVFGMLMNLAMQGTGTGAVISKANISRLPLVANKITIQRRGELGLAPPERRGEDTMVTMVNRGFLEIKTGDSRKGWVSSYQKLIDAAFDPLLADGELTITIDLSWVRPPGERLKGFGGTANPVALPEMYERVAKVLNGAVGRKLNALECCLLIDEAARCVVAGNIRRSAGMRQFDADDVSALGAKANLWVQDETGGWSIDPDRDALRMANHTRLFCQVPTLEEVTESVRSQHACGEGAIQFVPEALVRSNADLLGEEWLEQRFRSAVEEDGLQGGAEFLGLALFGHAELDDLAPEQRYEIDHRISRFGLNPCGEIIGSDFMCNLAEVHLNQLDPTNFEDVDDAFRAAAISVCALLHHRFHDERMRRSREIDPIVGVSFTGLFDYFVRLFGVEWLAWWAEGRPPHERGHEFSLIEHLHLKRFRGVVEAQVVDYCTRHGLRIPNRCTTVQPAGCLTMEAVRTTDQGIFLLDEIGEDLLTHAESLELSVRDGSRITDKVMNPPMTVVRLTLNSGRQITATYDHRFAVIDSSSTDLEPCWKQAGAICEGSDALVHSPVAPYEGRDYLLPGVVSSLKVTPPAINHELAYFAGVLLGRNAMKVTLPGHKHKEGSMLCMSFPAGLEPVAARFRKAAVSLFNVNFTRSPRGTQVFIHSDAVELMEWLSFQELLLVEHPDVDRLPLPLRRSSRQALIGFIAGLIDVTSLRARNKSLGLKLHHEPMARHLQQVAEAVGLVFSIKEVAERDAPYWLLTLSRFWSDPESLALLGRYSVLAGSRGCDPVSRDFGRNFFHVAKVERLEQLRLTGDISVAGASDDEHWYWQGGIKSHNSKSLLTNASPGWHPPKAPFYIRRITFAKDDPIALACMDYGYTIVPSQSDKDEQGRLLDDPFDPRCSEWLVEIPTATPWAHLEGADRYDPSKFSALAQFDFYMRVQQSYTTFNTSATIELTGEEVEPLAAAIHASMEAGTGYISAALLARFEDKQTYPRMPFEPVSKETYLQLCREVEERRSVDSFEEALKWRDAHVIHTLEASLAQEHGPAACDGDRCLLPQAGPNA
jgi:ribonucleotide reductase class II